MLYEIIDYTGKRLIATRHGLYVEMITFGNIAEVTSIVGCIEWEESYPILKRIADRIGYTIKEHNTDVIEL